MECFVISDYPEVCILDIKEITGKDATINGQMLLLAKATPEDIASLCCFCQSAKRVCVTYDNKLIGKAKTFALRATKFNREESTPKLEAELGAQIKDSSKLEVSLDNPDLLLHAYVGEITKIGIDITGQDLSKRPYKMFNQSSSIKGTLAYVLNRLAGITKDSIILDPFCGTGTIAIEAVMYQNRISPFLFENKFQVIPELKKAFDKIKNPEPNHKPIVSCFDVLLPSMMQAKKNAKLAGVDKLLNVSKVDVDWIDTKFDKHEVEFIITQPPLGNKHIEKKMRKLYDELFYQARYILKPKGKLCILFTNESLLENHKKHKFKLSEMHTIDTYKYAIFEVEKNG